MNEFRVKNVLRETVCVFSRYPGHFLIGAFLGGSIGLIPQCFSSLSRAAGIRLITMLVGLMLNGIMTGFMVGLAGEVIQRRRPGLWTNLRNIIPHAPALAGANLLWCLVMVVILYPTNSMLASGHIAVNFAGLGPLIGAVMFWLLICLWVPSLIFLGDRPLAAFSRSLRLTKGFSLRVLVAFSAIFGALTIASFIIALFFAIALGARLQSGRIVWSLGEISASVFKHFQSLISDSAGMLLAIPITVIFSALRREKVVCHESAPGWEFQSGR